MLMLAKLTLKQKIATSNCTRLLLVIAPFVFGDFLSCYLEERIYETISKMQTIAFLI